jgi:hypothetical protein
MQRAVERKKWSDEAVKRFIAAPFCREPGGSEQDERPKLPVDSCASRLSVALHDQFFHVGLAKTHVMTLGFDSGTRKRAGMVLQ